VVFLRNLGEKKSLPRKNGVWYSWFEKANSYQGTSIKTVAENDYNLAAGRYKPQIAEKAPDDDPAQLIRETLTIERDIAGGLEKLLREVENG
jgi:hypothetical protein